MKERFLELVGQMSTIEEEFHQDPSVPGLCVPSVPEIYDVQDFKIWIQAVRLEVQEIIDQTDDEFAKDTMKALSKSFNGWNDRSDFDEIKGRLLAMKGQVDKYYEGSANPAAPELPKVFISHSSKDKKYVEYIVSLLDDMGLNSTQIFCSSLPGYDIPLNENIFDYLRRQFQDFNLHLIIVHSDNYYRSAVCLNEMGAAWVHRNTCTSLLLPGFGFSQMVGVVNKDTTAIKLDGDVLEIKHKLNQLYDVMVEEFSLTKKTDILWEKKRDSFIESVRKLAEEASADAEETAASEPRHEKTDSDIEMLESGVYIRKSDVAAGKKICYCPACYIKEGKLYPIVAGTMARNMFCANCKMHYAKL